MLLDSMTHKSLDPSNEQIQTVLSALRRHLGMDVAFVSEFVDGCRIVRFADSAMVHHPIQAGRSDPAEHSLCHYVAHGLMPELLHDARENDVATRVEVTHELPIGAHLGVPLRYLDGTLFGSLCSFGAASDPTLTARDLDVLRLCADVISAALQDERLAAQDLEARKARIARIIEAKSIAMVFQPVYRTVDTCIAGFEALARFPVEPKRSPDRWFAEADAVGLGETLEFLAIETALPALEAVDPSLKLMLNLSPGAILSPRFPALLAGVPLARLVIELTEHATVPSYEALRAALAPMRAQGLRLAIDDVGAGHSTFRHVVEMAPELIKLDRSLIDGIHADPARRALAEALTSYGRRIGCEVVAEGVETVSDYTILQTIGVTRVQGYVLGRPMPLADAKALPLRHAALGYEAG